MLGFKVVCLNLQIPPPSVQLSTDRLKLRHKAVNLYDGAFYFELKLFCGVLCHFASGQAGIRLKVYQNGIKTGAERDCCAARSECADIAAPLEHE